MNSASERSQNNFKKKSVTRTSTVPEESGDDWVGDYKQAIFLAAFCWYYEVSRQQAERRCFLLRPRTNPLVWMSFRVSESERSFFRGVTQSIPMFTSWNTAQPWRGFYTPLEALNFNWGRCRNTRLLRISDLNSSTCAFDLLLSKE